MVSDGAERIFAAFEAQTRHRQSIEAAVVHGNENRAGRGQWMAYSLAIIILALGSVMIFTGHEWAGATLITVDLVGLVGVFVTSKVVQSKEREAKYEPGRRR